MMNDIKTTGLSCLSKPEWVRSYVVQSKATNYIYTNQF